MPPMPTADLQQGQERIWERNREGSGGCSEHSFQLESIWIGWQTSLGLESGYERNQHGKGGGTRCSARGHLSHICEKYKDGLLWPRHGSALLVQRPGGNRFKRRLNPLGEGGWTGGCKAELRKSLRS